jgi:hypothetical protein
MFLRLSAVALILALIGLPAVPVSAHAGDGLNHPVFEQMSPAVPGVEVAVVYSVDWQMLVTNRGSQTVTFLADSGEPFLDIAPGGVRGNLASPTFYDSNAPEGLTQFPDKAKPGLGVAPIWRKLSAQPSWGWFDHRLHPAQSPVPPAVQAAGKPAVLGRWRIPVRVGDQTGEVQGRFEFRPPTGSWTMVQSSTQTPADGVKIQTVSAQVVPATFVENLSSEPLVVLGKDNEPFARIGPRVSEVNVKSPTWAEQQQAVGKDPSDEIDAAAEPQWRQVADAPRWSWLEFRAAAPRTDPPQAVIDRGRRVTVKSWSVPYLIGGRKGVIEGTVDFLPLAELRRQAGVGSSRGSGGGPGKAIYAGAALAALALGGWFLRTRRRR